MRNRCRTRGRSKGPRKLNLYTRMVAHFAYLQKSEGSWRSWSFRLISQRQANLLVSLGEAVAVTRLVMPGEANAPENCPADGQVEVVGYRALKPTSWERPSPCTLTMSTMNAVAKEAMNAVHDGPREDLTRSEQRHLEKYIAWPLIGDTKAVAVRPRISEADRRRAEGMLANGRLAA